MKTFTVRDLDRKPAVVLDTCDREGVVRIRHRSGQGYTLRPDQPTVRPDDRRKWIAQHRAWVKRVFPKPIQMPREQLKELNKLIASDGRVL